MLNLKKLLYIFLRIALLLVIVVLGFTAIFPGWYGEREILMTEVANKFRSNEEIVIREQAKRLNIPYQQYLKNTQEKKRLAQLKQKMLYNIDLAFESQDPELLKQSLDQLELVDIPVNIFERAIGVENIELISALNETLPCGSIESLKASGGFNPNGLINSANRAILKSQSSELIQYWVASDCYLWGEDFFVKRILENDKQSLFDDIPSNQSTEKFWQQVLDESVTLKKSDYVASLISKDIAAIPSETFLMLIEQGLISAVNAVIEPDKSYIRENNLANTVINSFYKVRNPRGGQDIRSQIEQSILKSDLNGSLTNEQVLENVEKAIDSKNIHVFRILLAIDPTIDVSGYQDEQLASLNAFLQFRPELFLRLQQQHGLDIAKVQNEGLDQLSGAMSKGDLELVESLLEIGVQPRKFYKQGSILNLKIGGDEATVAAIKARLIEAGATEDVILLAHESNGKQYDPSCKVGEATVSDFNSPRYQGLIDKVLTESDSDNWNTYEICETTMLACTADPNNSLDDCFESTPTCSSDREANGFNLLDDSLSTDQLCCPAVAKTKYNDMRCAGLGVIESAWTIEGFSTVYTVPIIILNTNEYKESSQKRLEQEQIKEN